MYDESVINFAVYEDSVEYVGMATATLPNLSALVQTISGAGIAGNVEAPILGHYDAMTLGLSFRTTTSQSVKLSEPRRHNIDLRVAQQVEDTVAGAVKVQNVKHVLVVVPKTETGGSVPRQSHQWLRGVLRPLLGHLHRRHQSAGDRPSQLYLLYEWH